MSNRNNIIKKILLTTTIIGLSVSAAIVWMHVMEKKISEIAYSDFLIYCENNKVKHVTIYDQYLIAQIVINGDNKQNPPMVAFYKVKIHPNHLAFVDQIRDKTTVTFKLNKTNTLLHSVVNVFTQVILWVIMFYALRRIMNPPVEKNDNNDNLISNTPDIHEVVGFSSIKDNIINFLRYWTRIINDPNHSQDFIVTVLFKGEPGTGKTFMANVMAKCTGAKFLKIDIGGIGSPFIHQTSRNIQKFFDQARQLAEEGHKVILFLDEIDSLVSPRGDERGVSGEHVEVVTTILKNISGVRSDNEKKIMLIAATNNDRLDPAFHSRVSATFTFGLPSLRDRREIINFYITNDFKDCTWPTDWDLFAKLTFGESQRKIKTFMLNASVQAKSRDLDISKKTVVNLEDLFESIITGERAQEYWVSEDTKMSIAMHESGHALVGHFLHFHNFLPIAVNAIGITVGKSTTAGGVTFFGISDFSMLTEEESMQRLQYERYASIAWCITGIAGKIGEMFYFSMNSKLPDSTLGWMCDMQSIIHSLTIMYSGGIDISETKKVCAKILEKLENKINNVSVKIKRRSSYTYINTEESNVILNRSKESVEIEHISCNISDPKSVDNMLEQCLYKDILELHIDNKVIPIICFDFSSIVTESLKRNYQPINGAKIEFFVQNIRVFWLIGNLISGPNIDVFVNLSDFCKNKLLSEGGNFEKILNQIIEDRPMNFIEHKTI